MNESPTVKVFASVQPSAQFRSETVFSAGTHLIIRAETLPWAC
jgi:hypothetical protein